jgi:hypothetical protein
VYQFCCSCSIKFSSLAAWSKTCFRACKKCMQLQCPDHNNTLILERIWVRTLKTQTRSSLLISVEGWKKNHQFERLDLCQIQK